MKKGQFCGDWLNIYVTSFLQQSRKKYTPDKVLYNQKSWKSIKVIKNQDESSDIEVMLITHHRETISGHSSAVVMDVQDPRSPTLSPTWVWRHAPNTRLWAGSQDPGCCLSQECGHHEIEAPWRRWAEMKSLVSLSLARSSHRPACSASLSAPVTHGHTRTLFPGGKDRPRLLLPLGFCACCQLCGDACSISLSFWQPALLRSLSATLLKLPLMVSGTSGAISSRSYCALCFLPIYNVTKFIYSCLYVSLPSQP